MDESPDDFRDQKLTGLGGWLAFFVFTLYLGLFVEGVAAVLLFAFHGSLASSGLSEATFLAALIFLVASASIELWFLRLILKRKRSAIESVKTYLAAQVILNFVSGPLSSAVLNSLTINGVKFRDRTAGGNPLWWEVISAFFLPILWYFYFQRSRRVQLTLTQ